MHHHNDYSFTITNVFPGAITSATIKLDEPQEAQLADRDSLSLVIDGLTIGSPVTSVIWRRNGSVIITDNNFHVGGGEYVPYDDAFDCNWRTYRVALLVRGYHPGNYTYTADNSDTQDPGLTSPVFNVQGKYKIIMLYIHICIQYIYVYIIWLD